jgi:hypothetical protein
MSRRSVLTCVHRTTNKDSSHRFSQALPRTAAAVVEHWDFSFCHIAWNAHWRTGSCRIDALRPECASRGSGQTQLGAEMEVLPRVYHPVIPCMNISRALGYVLLVTMARCVWTALRIQLCFLSSCKHYRLHQLWPTAPPSNWPLNKMPSLPLCSSRMLGLKISPILYGLFIRDSRINSTSLAFPSPRQKTPDLTSDALRDSQAEPPAQM